MTRRMSCSMTTDAVRDRSKTVTRRAPHTWPDLKAGDRLTLVEKAMGLPKGSHQVVLAEVEIVDVRLEPLCAIFAEAPPMTDPTVEHRYEAYARAHGRTSIVQWAADADHPGGRYVPFLTWITARWMTFTTVARIDPTDPPDAAQLAFDRWLRLQEIISKTPLTAAWAATGEPSNEHRTARARLRLAYRTEHQ